MLKKCLLLLAVLCAAPAFAQTMQVSGRVQDTVAKTPLQGAVAMAVRLADSVLVKHARTDRQGMFALSQLPLDTYQVVVSHPQFADQVFIVIGSEKNNLYDFGRIVLPLKTQQLNEIVVYAFKDPIYYRGDTLVYTADSFKVRPNATVEDLLKRLPGIKVDAQGKITTQGKTVDQVLVDGDEFFGSDPTTATRNLNASSIESVQVYDKKNEDANSSTTADNETIKVMNLKLKEEAKKGYFGKLSGAGGASDATLQNTFYEGEFLANKFNKKRKISVFALAGNTPKTNFGFQDIFRYGLTGDMNFDESEEGMYFFNFSDRSEGIPQTLKTGAYFTDKPGKNTKILGNYTFGQSQLTSQSETRSQYFLSDTSYTTSNVSSTVQRGQNHVLNFTIEQNVDSLTRLTIKPKFTMGESANEHSEVNQFRTTEDTLTRQTDISNTSNGVSYELTNKLKLRREFRKPDRVLRLDYDFDMSRSDGNGILKTKNQYYTAIAAPIADVDQKKTNEAASMGHDLSLSFTEPFTKKIKLELMLDYVTHRGNQEKLTLNYGNGDYTLRDSVLSNSFENSRNTWRTGLRFIYETNKVRFAAGARARQVQVSNHNLVTNQVISQDVKNILPFLSYRYKFTDNKRLSLGYYTSSSLPSINQLQPVPNNSNPNHVSLGNPDLLPSFEHHFEMNYNSYKPLTGKNLYGGLNASFKDNDFSTSTAYDEIGRTITQPVNVNGNLSADGFFGMGLPFFSQKLTLEPNLSAAYSSNTNYINSEKNVTSNLSVASDLRVVYDKEKINIEVKGSYEYNVPSSTLNAQSNKPYATQGYEAGITWDLRWKLSISSNAEYVINTRRTAGFNVSYVLWHMTLSRKFLKNENLVLSVIGRDLLNQNVSATRSVQANVITDNKTTIIKRYVLLQLTWKFNSQRKKEDNEWGD
jgi:hypothetical protein